MAPKNPMGTPKRVASRSILALPRMALAMPPPVSPEGEGKLRKQIRVEETPKKKNKITKKEKGKENTHQATHAGNGQHKPPQNFAPAKRGAHTSPTPRPRGEGVTISKRAK